MAIAQSRFERAWAMIKQTDRFSSAARLFLRGFSNGSLPLYARLGARVKASGNETRGKTFLSRGPAWTHFLCSTPPARRIEVPPAALENGLLRLIVGASQARVVEIKTGGVT
jgi:hypothetical protein